MRKTLSIVPLLLAACGADPQLPVATHASAVRDFVTIYANPDTWFQSTLAGTKDYGGSCALRVATPTSFVPGSALLKFPLGEVDCSLISGANDSAWLVLNTSAVDGASVDVGVYEVTSSWSAGTTGGAGCTSCGVTTDLSAGAAFAAPSRAAAPRATFTVTAACTDYKVDVTALVRDWCDDPAGHPNHGLMLRALTGGGVAPPKAVVFHSVDGPVAERPNLWIGHPDTDGDGI